MPDRRTDCLVIGAGVVGAAVAQRLARQGRSVLVLDAAPGPGGGCSYANAALLAPHHVSPLATPAMLREAPLQMIRRPPAVRIRPDRTLVPWLYRLAGSAARGRSTLALERLRELAVTSVELHQELADQGLNPGLRQTGALDVYPPRRRAATTEVPEHRVPGLIHGAVHFDSREWVLESRGFVGSLLGDAVDNGARLHFDTKVTGVRPAGPGSVRVGTTGGEILAQRVIVAAGLHSRTIADGLGVPLPLRGGRGYVIDLAVDSIAGTAAMPALPLRLKEHRIVITPLPDRLRVCGSIEFGDESRPVDLRRADRLRAAAARYLPVLAGLPVIDRWAGERPCTNDGLPVIGRPAEVPGVHFATGHGMWGMILAPVTARLVAQDIATGGKDPVPDWLGPDRFRR